MLNGEGQTGNTNFEGGSANPQDGMQLGEQQPSFEIPEEYQQKDWVKNFEGQSGDDLKANIFKTLDEKYSNLPVIPENADGYSFNDILKDENGELQYEYPDEALSFFGDKFKELGISKEQGQGILKSYTDFELEQFEKYTNAEELDQSINAMFDGNIQQKNNVESLIKEFLPQEDQAFLQKTAPNHTIIMFYKLAKGFTDKYAFKEGTGAGNRNNGSLRMSKAERDAEYNKLVDEMENLTKRPHTTEEKENLQRKLDALFN